MVPLKRQVKMVTPNNIDSLKNLRESILAIDENRLLRPGLGSLSIVNEFSERLKRIKGRLDQAIELYDQVSNNQITELTNILDEIRQEMGQQAGYEDSDYAANRDVFLERIDEKLNRFEGFWLPFMSVLFDKRGFVDDEILRRQREEELQKLRDESQNFLVDVQNQATQAIQAARQSSDEILGRARLTATGVSVGAAQDQFKGAQPDLDRQMWIWASLSLAGIISFILFALSFLDYNFSDQSTLQIIYKGILRFSLVAFIGTVTAFFVKMFRAHLYLREKNKHRVRVANCIEAFVNSASTEEQRDAILSQLVDSITQFGNSGLIQREDENIPRPKMNIESIIKTLSSKPPV